MVKMAPASPRRIPLIFDSLSCSNKVTALYSGRLPMATRIAVCHHLVAYRSYSGGSWCSTCASSKRSPMLDHRSHNGRSCPWTQAAITEEKDDRLCILYG